MDFTEHRTRTLERYSIRSLLSKVKPIVNNG